MESQKAQSVNRAIKSKRILSVIALLGLVVPGISATSSQASTFQPLIDLGTSANLSLADNATIYPGVYTTPGGAAMSVDQNLILDARGDANATFVFVAPTAFNTSAAITVFLQNGAKASNIYWVVGAGMTLGASTNISGNFLVTAGTTVGASSTVNGRILSQDSVTLGASAVLIS